HRGGEALTEDGIWRAKPSRPPNSRCTTKTLLGNALGHSRRVHQRHAWPLEHRLGPAARSRTLATAQLKLAPPAAAAHARRPAPRRRGNTRRYEHPDPPAFAPTAPRPAYPAWRSRLAP